MTFVVTQTPEERLAGLTVLDGDCLLFTGTKNNFGYGWFWFEGKNVLVHRWVWQNEHGPIPKGAEIHHTCNRKLCVNPEHLEMMKDRAAHWEASDDSAPEQPAREERTEDPLHPRSRARWREPWHRPLRQSQTAASLPHLPASTAAALLLREKVGERRPMTDEGQMGDPVDAVELAHGMASLGASAWSLFQGFMDAGFSEAQALKLVSSYLHGLAGGKLEGS